MLKVTSDIDLSTDVHISNLMANFAQDNTLPKLSVPSWSFAFVIQAPFEPFKDATLKLLTLKTIIFVTLALGKYCSEIHVVRPDSLLHDQSLPPDLPVSKADLANKLPWSRLSPLIHSRAS